MAAVYYGDLLKLSPSDSTWTVVEQKGDIPPKREGHSLTSIGNGLLLLFGGSGDPDSTVCYSTTHLFDIKTRTWSLVSTNGTAPSARLNHSASFVNGKLYIFGGFCDGEASRDLYILDTATLTWTKPKTTGDIPAPRCDHSSSVIGNKVYLFGGSGGINILHNDLCCLDTETLTWTILPATGAAPTVRDFCSMCSFTVDNNSYLAVFGGANENEETNVIIHFNDLHLYDLAKMTWLAITVSNPPSVRWGHSANVISSSMYVIGGTSEEADFSDVYLLHLPEKATPPAPFTSSSIPASAASITNITTPTTTTSSTSTAASTTSARPRTASSHHVASYSTPTPIPAPEPIIEAKKVPATAVSSDVYAAIDALEHTVLSTLGQFFHKLREQHAHIDHQLLQLEEDKKALEATRTAQSEIFAQQQREVDDLIQRHKKENEAWISERQAEFDVQKAACDAEWAHLRAQQEQLAADKEAFIEKNKKLDAIMKQFQGLSS